MEQYYDVVVNSMVINCVTAPSDRGLMLLRCYKLLRPGGLCFLTLPKLCLNQSKYITRALFEDILTKGIGFELSKDAKDSPKIAFFVLRRPLVNNRKGGKSQSDRFRTMVDLKSNKKYRNTFAVTL